MNNNNRMGNTLYLQKEKKVKKGKIKESTKGDDTIPGKKDRS
jgi:hypothetical protein